MRDIGQPQGDPVARPDTEGPPAARQTPGLGLQIAEALGDQGARLVISSRKADDLAAAKAHLQARGINVEYIVADNAKDADIQRLATESMGILEKIDILVNNAGATWGSPPRSIPSTHGTR